MENNGFFGKWGGAFIPEILHETFEQLKIKFQKSQRRPKILAGIP